MIEYEEDRDPVPPGAADDPSDRDAVDVQACAGCQHPRYQHTQAACWERVTQGGITRYCRCPGFEEEDT